MNIQYFFIGLLICFPNVLYGQSTDTLHFTLTSSNNISIQAILNEADTIDLMFHTAANGVTLTKEAIQKIERIRFENVADTVKSWGGSSTAKHSLDNKLKMGNQVWTGITIWENKYSGPGTDGKFGFNFFNKYIVEINFTHDYIVLHTKTPKLNGYQKLGLTTENGFLFLEGKALIDEEGISNRFLIHSGYGGAILFDDEFANNNLLGEKLQITSESELKDSYGNILKTQKATLSTFIIGDITHQDVPASFFEGAIGRQKMSVLGGEMLKQHDIIFNIPKGEVYLKPSKYYAKNQK